MKLMTHLIAGYPNYQDSLQIAVALVQSGADILEIQFPFSDPTADGPLICEASTVSLQNGFTVSKGFQLVSEITSRFPEIPVYIMGYANTVFTPGVVSFVQSAKKSGAKGLIIPDLPFDCDEGLFEEGENEGVEIVPVIAPNASRERLIPLLKKGNGLIYAVLRGGITGSETVIDQGTAQFLRSLNELLPEEGTREIAAGFGIRKKEQISALLPYCSIVVAGSVFVQKIKDSLKLEDKKRFEAIASLVSELKI